MNVKNDLTIVNVVGSGEVDAEIDLPVLADDLSLETVYIEGPGLYFKFRENGPTVVLARTGKYIISGARSEDELQDTRSKVLSLLENMDVINDRTDVSFSVKNIVSTYDLKKDVDLSALAVHAGLENIEYEPEQFPGLIFRPKTTNSVALIFSTGKIVVTGLKVESIAKDTIEEVMTLVEGVGKVR